MLYNEKVKDLFLNPHNLGEIENADGVGEVGNAKCGDIMKIWIKVNPKTQIVEDVKFKTFGCAAAIATSSIITDMAIGKTLEEAEEITNQDVAKELGGLPNSKLHCSNLAADALKKAIHEYKEKQEKENKPQNTVEKTENHIHRKMTVAEVIENHPQVIGVLMQFGFHCIDCQMSSIENLEEASAKHGVDVNELVDVLNGTIN